MPKRIFVRCILIFPDDYHTSRGNRKREGINHEQGRKHRVREKKTNPGCIPNGRGSPGASMVNIAPVNPDVNYYHYTEEILDDLEASLSPERLGTYLDATDGNRENAIRLHVWNTVVSSAFYEPLQILEVTLRNAMNRRLGEEYGENWYDKNETGLNQGALNRIRGAKNQLTSLGYNHDPHRIVAALSLGFWVSLLKRGDEADYEMTLWRPALRGSFPHRETLERSMAFGPLNTLRLLRNRIAHHEPIFSRNLVEEHELILEIVGWISPPTQEWIRHHSRVPKLLLTARDAGVIRTAGFPRHSCK